MDTALLSLALSAGALAALNPCGFALLPAYLGLMLRDAPTVPRALGLSATMTLGFVAVFAAFGLLVAPVAASVQQYLPWVTLTTGLALLVLGVLLLAGRELRVPSLRIPGRDLDGSFVSVLLYGVVYALASLTCTVAPFLAVVVTSLRSSELGAGLALFVAYAVGMGLVVALAAVAVSLARTGLVGRMRRAGRLLPLLSGGLLVLVGAYVAYYGLWEVRVLAGADPDDPVIDGALAVQGWLSDLVRTVLP